jgi:hypothetical protein
MAEGRRPGGLTALAVLNFVFGGISLLFLSAVFALLSAADKAGALDEASKEVHLSKGLVYGMILLGIARVLIEIAAGVGYLKMKKWGKTLGNTYAILGLLDTVVGVAVAHQGFGIAAIIGLIYPVLTLILLNTTFKDDLVN